MEEGGWSYTEGLGGRWVTLFLSPSPGTAGSRTEVISGWLEGTGVRLVGPDGLMEREGEGLEEGETSPMSKSRP